MHFFSQTRIQSLNFVFLIFLLVFGLFTTSAFAQGPSEFSESFYTLILNEDNDDDIAEGLEMCSIRFRAALTSGRYQERASRETEELVSSCNRERSSADYIEQCVLESTQNTVDLVLILSVQSIRHRGFIFQARMIRTMGEAIIWGDNVHIEDEEVIVLAAQEACNQLAVSLAEELNIDSSPNPTPSPNQISTTSWSVFELVNVSPRVVVVNIDGVEVGITPGQFEISPGPHILTLSAPGYASLERNMRAPENSILTLDDFVLEPLDATLTITSNVAGASIIVDGQQINTTIPGRPIQVEIPPDSRTLEVEREGYLTHTESLSLTPGGRVSVTVDLVLRARVPHETTSGGMDPSDILNLQRSGLNVSVIVLVIQDSRSLDITENDVDQLRDQGVHPDVLEAICTEIGCLDASTDGSANKRITGSNRSGMKTTFYWIH